MLDFYIYFRVEDKSITKGYNSHGNVSQSSLAFKKKLLMGSIYAHRIVVVNFEMSGHAVFYLIFDLEMTHIKLKPLVI